MTTTTKSVHCVRDLRDVPASAYRLPTDGRKWLHAAGQRQRVAMLLATYADGDGGRVRPSRKTIAHLLGMGLRTVQRLLDDLETLGLQHKVGLDGEHGCAVRKLNVDAMRARAGVPDTPEQECQIREQECQIQKQECQIREQECHLGGTQPSGLPSIQPPPTATESTAGWWRRFSKRTATIPAMLGATITAGQKRDLHAQFLRCGYDDLMASIREWADKRAMPVEGRRDKWGAWLDEGEPFLDRRVAERKAAAQKVKDDAAQAASIERQTADLRARSFSAPKDDGWGVTDVMAEDTIENVDPEPAVEPVTHCGDCVCPTTS